MKKDPDYVAAVEKAMAKKYGNISVQDFRSSWSPEDEKRYLEQLKKITYSKNVSTGKHKIETEQLIISKRPYVKKGTRSCPVCKTYSFSSRDDLYMKRFYCCFECYVDFIEHREDDWESGQRPNDEELLYAMRRRKQNV